LFTHSIWPLRPARIRQHSQPWNGASFQGWECCRILASRRGQIECANNVKLMYFIQTFYNIDRLHEIGHRALATWWSMLMKGTGRLQDTLWRWRSIFRTHSLQGGQVSWCALWYRRGVLKMHRGEGRTSWTCHEGEKSFSGHVICTEGGCRDAVIAEHPLNYVVHCASQKNIYTAA